jgi:hypothetical protein
MQHLDFVRTCEFFASISMIFAIVYLIVGHYPTYKNEILKMEEFKESNHTDDNNGLQLESQRSTPSVDHESVNGAYKIDHNQLPQFNDTIETFDGDQL